jgi:hypothetical protein
MSIIYISEKVFYEIMRNYRISRHGTQENIIRYMLIDDGQLRLEANTQKLYNVLVFHVNPHSIYKKKYSCAQISASNMFQDIPPLRETANNTESYM